VTERWWVDPAAAGRLAARGLSRLDDLAVAVRAGRTLSTDRQAAAVLLDGDPPLLVKWRHTLPGRRWRTWGRPSRERAEARALRRAAALGVPVPRPLAVAERRSRGVLVAAALVRPFVPGHATVATRLAARPAERAHDVAAFAAGLRGLHDGGFRHGGCYPKNFLVPDAGDGPLVPVGFPAARFAAPGPRVDRARAKDLAQALAGLAPFDVPAAEFLAAYGAEPGLPPLADLERLVARRLRRVLAKKSERLATRPAREPGGAPPPVPIRPAPDVRFGALGPP
jgi:hypothetical protein